MHYHLELHNLEHSHRVKQSESERRALEEQRANQKKSSVRQSVGALLVEVGERLQQDDNHAVRVSPAR